MSDSLNRRLATLTGCRDFDGIVAALIRAGNYKEGESLLIHELGQRSSPVADAARATTSVQLAGWEDINAESEWLVIERQIAITAIGLGLSNHNESLTPVWHDKEPAVEFGVYTDKPFKFSSSSLEELRRLSAAPPAPWQGEMAGETNASLAVSGLRALNSALLAYSNERPWKPSDKHDGSVTAPDEYVAFAIGEWMRHLRFHEAIARHIDEHGLALLVPVLIGAHDVGPFIQCVVMPTSVANHRSTTDRINTERKAKYRAEFDAVTEEFISTLDEMRRAISSMGFFAGARKQKVIAIVEAQEGAYLKIVDLKLRKSTWKMSDAEFQEFASAYRAARETWGTKGSKGAGGSSGARSL